MADIRVKELARRLINYSVKLQKGENLFIRSYGNDKTLAKELIKECYKVGGKPFLHNVDDELQRLLIQDCDEEQMAIIYKSELELMKQMDAYIGVYACLNSNEYAGIDAEKMEIYNKASVESFNYRCEKTKWCILNSPTPQLAQAANMNTEDFEDFYFRVCNMDYSKMSNAMDNLVTLMNKTDKVRIVANNTNLTFSIKDLDAVKCAGEANIPDGEVYTAPVKDTVNGYITYNTPSIYNGQTFENIYLEFKDGKIVKATSNYTEKLNQILDTDEGARYLGEFSFGVNPFITVPTNDGGIDEKLAGSIHLTPGDCYEEADNGNHSKIHWDLVLLQTEEYGGGEIYFDDVLIRKNGKFVLKELEALNSYE